MIRQFSAGGAVYKREKTETFWLLIQPARDDKFHQEIRWQLPKGWLNEGEKSPDAAIREVREEGGVDAGLIGKIDAIQIFFRNTFEGKPDEKVLKTITFYLMHYLADAKEGHDQEVAEVIWLPFAEAEERLTFKNEKEILEKAQKILADGSSQTSLFASK